MTHAPKSTRGSMRTKKEEAKMEITKKIRPTQKAHLQLVFHVNSRRHISRCEISICQSNIQRTLAGLHCSRKRQWTDGTQRR
jgi:hypothetical protein